MRNWVGGGEQMQQRMQKRAKEEEDEGAIEGRHIGTGREVAAKQGRRWRQRRVHA